MVSRFYLIPKTSRTDHGWMDGQTDIIAISISRVSVLKTLTRDKNVQIIVLQLRSYKVYTLNCCTATVLGRRPSRLISGINREFKFYEF